MYLMQSQRKTTLLLVVHSSSESSLNLQYARSPAEKTHTPHMAFPDFYCTNGEGTCFGLWESPIDGRHGPPTPPSATTRAVTHNECAGTQNPSAGEKVSTE
ncbi:hypothetical protein ElyMa_005179500 [Elysia marginata]|uniref:Secreted protein n=1 Tax=Elysia marginata TaxID=1093978 RepID=A0AAV4JWH3_9GAST|nr:hypothetical protein ElyMa_005179500 [Elysia marginata]